MKLQGNVKMTKMNKAQNEYIEIHLSIAANAELSANQLLADEHFMLALEADEALTSLRKSKFETTLLSEDEHEKLEAAHQKGG